MTPGFATDLAALRRSAERTVRAFYAYEQTLPHVNADEFGKAWRPAAELLSRSPPSLDALRLIAVNASCSSYNEGRVSLVGIAAPDGTGFTLRQVVVTNPHFEPALLQWCAEELKQTTCALVHNDDHEFTNLLGRLRANRLATPKPSSVYDLKHLAQVHLPFTDSLYGVMRALGLEMPSLWGRENDLKELLKEYGQSEPDEEVWNRSQALRRLLTDNCSRVLGMIELARRLGRQLGDTRQRTPEAWLMLATQAQHRKDWAGSVDLFRQTLQALRKNAGHPNLEDALLDVELRLSLSYKHLHRFVEALEVWNRLANLGVLRAMRELVQFYEKVDPDPARAVELCHKFLAMDAGALDGGWLKHHLLVAEARARGAPPPKRPRPSASIDIHAYAIRRQPGGIDYTTSKRKGRIVRYPEVPSWRRRGWS